MDILLKDNGKPLVEHLKFTNEGRPHKHAEFESFFVLKGSGQVYVGEKVFEVVPGSQVLIPPGSNHWMKPNEGVLLEGLLWYHSDPLTFNR